ncbi:MAG: CRISPR-associated endonuclease Cas2 [bacterium]
MGKVSKIVLKGLSLTGEVLMNFFDAIDDMHPATVYRKAYGGIPIQEYRRDAERREETKRRRAEYLRMKRLERQKFIKLKREGDELWYKLTNIGYEEALKLKIVNKKDELPEGEFCVVTFDIPEDIREVRYALRALLKKAGFMMEQKSVWESNVDVVFELQEFVYLLKADKYVTVYRAMKLR